MCHKVSESLGSPPNILVRIWGWGGGGQARMRIPEVLILSHEFY